MKPDRGSQGHQQHPRPERNRGPSRAPPRRWRMLGQSFGNKPVLISSGYRSPKLNKAIGGSSTSAHMSGLAADFSCPGFGTPLAICKELQAAHGRD